MNSLGLLGSFQTVELSCQEIAEALKGTSMPVFVKNPVNAELSLWIGALERLDLMGLKHLSAIHRGGHTAEKNACN